MIRPRVNEAPQPINRYQLATGADVPLAKPNFSSLILMNFAFAIVSLFPGGGLQRDCVDIARRVRELGHEVTIFTSRTSGEGFAEDLPVHVLEHLTKRLNR